MTASARQQPRAEACVETRNNLPGLPSLAMPSWQSSSVRPGRLQASGFRLQASGFTLQASD